MTSFPIPTTFKAMVLQACATLDDPLLASAQTAWACSVKTGPISPLFERVWRERQADVAALRLLALAALEGWPVETQVEREQILFHLLFNKEEALRLEQGLSLFLCTHQDRLLHLVDRMNHWHSRVNIAGYQAIANEARILGWPHAPFDREVEETASALLTAPNAPKTFWWSVSKNSSRLLRPNNLSDVRSASQTAVQGRACLHYVYDGLTLEQMEQGEWLSSLIASLDPDHYWLCWLEARCLHSRLLRRGTLTQWPCMSVKEAQALQMQRIRSLTEAKGLVKRTWEDYQAVLTIKGNPVYASL